MTGFRLYLIYARPSEPVLTQSCLFLQRPAFQCMSLWRQTLPDPCKGGGLKVLARALSTAASIMRATVECTRDILSSSLWEGPSKHTKINPCRD